MDRRLRRSLVLVLVLAASFFHARNGTAAPKDAAATKLADEAINRDYLATNFAEAEKKLRAAIAMCTPASCSAQVRGRLNRDLGVVLIAGLNRVEDGKQAFVEALRADPDVALEKDLTTPEIDQAFKAVKAGGVPAAKPPAPAAPGGDIAHTPANEQLTMTAMPIYVELPDGIAVVKVIARYKPFGTPDWKTVELRRLGEGYGGEISCQDVGSATGDMTYYVQATDAAGDVVATSGSRAAPNKVPVRYELTGEAPHLPGKPPPSRCHESADCPPGLPGCGASASKKISTTRGWGATCESDEQCGSGFWCKKGACESGVRTDDAAEEKASGKYCDSSLECETGERCSAERVCERAPEKPQKVWLSLNAGQDFTFVGSQGNVCGTPQDFAAHSYACFEDTDRTYEGVPDFGGPETGNGIKGGVGPANTRIMVGLEYLVANNVTLGARLGYVLRTAPGRTLAAFHAEARIAFWFGREPFSRHGVRPYLAVVGGLAEVNNKFTVPVIETNPMLPTYPSTDLTVWRHSGSAFAGGGLGLMVPTSGAGQGVTAEFKVVALFPDAGVAMLPTIGYALGL